MDTISAFAMGRANRHKPLMVFDWTKAATLIKERGTQRAAAGLAGDWENTGGAILEAGRPVMDSYTYLSSTWAEPELKLMAEDLVFTMPCWRYESEVPWNNRTKWPPDALAILNGEPLPDPGSIKSLPPL